MDQGEWRTIDLFQQNLLAVLGEWLCRSTPGHSLPVSGWEGLWRWWHGHRSRSPLVILIMNNNQSQNCTISISPFVWKNNCLAWPCISRLRSSHHPQPELPFKTGDFWEGMISKVLGKSPSLNTFCLCAHLFEMLSLGLILLLFKNVFLSIVFQ